jgi:hypothetical protein
MIVAILETCTHSSLLLMRLKARANAPRQNSLRRQRLSKDNRWSSISRVEVKLLKDYPAEKVRALFETTYVAGLRKAGMPEQ